MSERSAAVETQPELGIGPEPTPSGSYVPAASGAFPAQPTDLVYESGLELQARSQWAYARQRFFRHRLAMVSLVLLVCIFAVGIFANFIAPIGFVNSILLPNDGVSNAGWLCSQLKRSADALPVAWGRMHLTVAPQI